MTYDVRNAADTTSAAIMHRLCAWRRPLLIRNHPAVSSTNEVALRAAFSAGRSVTVIFRD